MSPENSGSSRVLPVIFATLLVVACVKVEALANRKHAPAKRHTAVSVNTLTDAERRAGWKLLFDGKTTAGWRGYHREMFPRGRWVVRDNSLHHFAGAGDQSTDGGDIITINQYSNFELSLEWKLAGGGNSGVKYFIDESLPPLAGSSIYSGVGFEMQILDDDKHPDAKKGKDGNRTAGSLYDLIAAQGKILKPIGEFNHARLIVNGTRVQHWLNGRKVVEYELGSDRLKQLVAESKYKDTPGFGTWKRGHILLQDHGDAVWFRNIKIRELRRVQSARQSSTSSSNRATKNRIVSR